MKPVLLIHGYSSEGTDSTVKQIYGTLPKLLRRALGTGSVVELNLSRWISLNDGIGLSDVSLAMDRALQADHPKLLADGFHVVIHSTGALVVRDWIRRYSKKPCPIGNLVHLAGANFGSGLAHIGKGQLARWARLILEHSGSGCRVLDALEFGSWESLDLQCHFLAEGQDMFKNYKVREYCIIGSQIPKPLRLIPIRYIKEDSSDNTVRTSAGNLNFNHISVRPNAHAAALSAAQVNGLLRKRAGGRRIEELNYDFDLSQVSSSRQEVPFAIPFETAHFGPKLGIVDGSENRVDVIPLIVEALQAGTGVAAYRSVARSFRAVTASTMERASGMRTFLGWSPQSQYEGHCQLIFRLKDQFGRGVTHFDITFRSIGGRHADTRLERCIEDRRVNTKHPGTITFYVRTQAYDRQAKTFKDLIPEMRPVDMEITGYEPLSEDIAYVPLSVTLSPQNLQEAMGNFQTTLIDVELVRLPTTKVFAVKGA